MNRKITVTMCVGLVLGLSALALSTGCKSAAKGVEGVRKAAKAAVGISPTAVIFANAKAARQNAALKAAFDSNKQAASMLMPKADACDKYAKPEQFDAVTVLVFAKQGIFYVAVTGSFDAKGALKCMAKGKKPKATINGIPIYQKGKEPMMFAGSKSSMVGVGKLPAKAGAALGASPMALLGDGGFLQKLKPGKSVLGKGLLHPVAGEVFTLNVQGLGDVTIPKIPMLKVDLSLDSIWASVKASDPLKVALNVRFGKEETAKKLEGMYKKMAPGLKKKAGKRGPPAVKGIVDSVALKRSGATLSLALSIPSKDLSGLGRMVMGQVMKRAMGGMGKMGKRGKRGAATSEAMLNIKAIGDGAVAWFDAEHAATNGDPLPKHFPGGGKPGTVQAGSYTAPAAKPCAGGKRPLYPKNLATWNKNPWRSLKFGVFKEHRFQYTYKTSGVGTKATFTIIARADLDCDGKLSTYKQTGTVNPSTGEVERSNIAIINGLE